MANLDLKDAISSVIKKHGDGFIHRYGKAAVRTLLDSFDALAFLDGITGDNGGAGLPAFNEVQRKFLADKRKFKLFRAARRTGKSYAGAADVIKYVMMPHTRGWCVGPTYDLANQEFTYIVAFIKAAIAKYNLPPIRVLRQNVQTGDLYLKTAWGSEVIGKSADKPNNLVGVENDWVLMCEAAMQKEETFFKYVLPTLMTRNGSAILPSTPDTGSIWLYNLEVETAYKNPDEWLVLHCTAMESGHIDRKEIEKMRKMMGEAEFDEQVNGNWRFQKGRVYKFDRDIHVVEPFDIPTDWSIFCGVDFGATRDATAVVYCAESPQGDYYCFDEHYKASVTTGHHVNAVFNMEKKFHSVSVRVADFHALGRQLMIDWAANGIDTIPCSHDRIAKRSRLAALIELQDNRKPYHEEESGNYPRLFVMKDKCPNFVRELMFLRWKGNDGSYTGKQGSTNDTVGDDHSTAAVENVLFYVTDNEWRTKLRRQRPSISRPAPSKLAWI